MFKKKHNNSTYNDVTIKFVHLYITKMKQHVNMDK